MLLSSISDVVSSLNKLSSSYHIEKRHRDRWDRINPAYIGQYLTKSEGIIDTLMSMKFDMKKFKK